jgi:phosphoglycolate phosphatase
MFKYVLFDLDGTLTDSGEGITKAVQYALHEQGIEEPDLHRLDSFVGPPLDVSFKSRYGMNDEQMLRAVKKFREYYEPVGIFENRVYEGIPEMLSACRKEGITLAVASSKPQLFVHQVLEHFDIEKYFSVIVGSEMDGRRTDKKEVVEEALRQLTELAKDNNAVKTQQLRENMELQTAMVGDRCYDMEGAAQHHLKAVGVSYGYGSEEELKEAGAHMVAGTVAELQKVLLK